MYLYELIQWLTTVVDGLAVKDEFKDDAYGGAVRYVAECLLVRAPRSRPCARELTLTRTRRTSSWAAASR